MMKKTNITQSDDTLPEYNFDYSKARRNRFAEAGENDCIITLDPDVAKFFTSSESVNNILRAVIRSLPENGVKKIVNQ